MRTQRLTQLCFGLLVVSISTSVVGCGSTALTGSGDIAETTYSDLGQFVRLKTDSSVSVRVTNGDQREVAVRADDNVIENVLVDSSGDTLSIRVDPGVRLSDATLEVAVVTPDLRAIEANGASDVEVLDAFGSDRFEFSATGASEVRAELTASEAELSASGSSRVELSGSSFSVAAEVVGASEMDLGELAVEDMKIELSGASSAVVTVTGNLSASASGASDLRYEGDPTIERSDTSGSSSIEPV